MLDTDAPVKYHVLRLSSEDVRRRWPARDLVQAAYEGFAADAAARAGWKVGPKPLRVVQKTVQCTVEATF